MGRPIGRNKKTKKLYQKFSKKVRIRPPKKNTRFNPIIIPIGEKVEKKK